MYPINLFCLEVYKEQVTILENHHSTGRPAYELVLCTLVLVAIRLHWFDVSMRIQWVRCSSKAKYPFKYQQYSSWISYSNKNLLLISRRKGLTLSFVFLMWSCLSNLILKYKLFYYKLLLFPPYISLRTLWVNRELIVCHMYFKSCTYESLVILTITPWDGYSYPQLREKKLRPREVR